MDTKVESFASAYPFPLDPYQLEALEVLARADSVLVAAPTGSGKTVVGEFAVWLALREGGKAFYTTPLKALSNQKFGDFIALHGAPSVGLLTGDNSINPRASIVVMTTEVLRNMIYERSDLLEDLRYVVLDEVHYLQDPYRGAVWEEVIIHLPMDVRVVSLSATVSNVEEFADWMQTVRGRTSAVVETRRPVELLHHYLIDKRVLPMFVQRDGEPAPNPQVIRIEAGFDKGFKGSPGHQRGSRRRPHSHQRGPRRRFPPRADVIETLSGNGMLPAIYFIFSRKGCDAAVQRCLAEGLRLTEVEERARIREFAEMRCSYLPDEDLDILGYPMWLEGLVNGLAAHHAGLIPVFKEAVEELFQMGLVKVVFATETLSLGINMPARTVVIESMVKFTGERHELMSAGEFTQLTGRAGRRGIDSLGHAVVIEQSDVSFRQVAGLASTTVYPLLSSFQPSYNMATNLIRNYSRAEAEHLLNSSFAQYRGDKEVVVLEGRVERNDAYLASYREKMACHLGDFEEYWRMRERVTRLERSMARWETTRRKQQTRDALAVARPGQVFVMPGGKARGPVVLVGTERSRRGEPRLLAVTANRRLVRLSPQDFESPPRAVATLSSVRGWAPGRRLDHDVRRRLAAELVALDIDEDPSTTEDAGGAPTELGTLKLRIDAHPCNECPDLPKHAQWAERASRLERETAGLRRQVRSRTSTLSTRFEKILEILRERGYVKDFSLTGEGLLLTKIYNVNDLLLAESLNAGIVSRLDAGEICAVFAAFVFESRGPLEQTGSMPTERTRTAYRKIEKLADEIRTRESSAGLTLTRGTEAGFSEIVYRWSQGAPLEDVLEDQTTAGDFIRSCKQTLDLLKQVRDSGMDGEFTVRIDEAIDAVNRGVVAYTGVV